MARPATTLPICQELHSLLMASGVEAGNRIPRTLFDKLVVRAIQVGIKQAENITKTGRAAGLWEVQVGHGPKPGYVTLLAQDATNLIDDAGSSQGIAQEQEPVLLM